MKYYSLSNRTSQEGQLRCALDEFPWTTATKNCTSLLCSVENLAKRAEKQSSFLCLHLSNTPFFLFPDVALPPLLFWSPKHAFRLHPNLQPADYYSFGEKDLPFISEIITLQWRAGELCIWQLPAGRCMWGITAHSGKVIPETGLYSELQCMQLKLLYSGVLCYFLYIKARHSLWRQDNQFPSFVYSQNHNWEGKFLFLLVVVLVNTEMHQHSRTKKLSIIQ